MGLLRIQNSQPHSSSIYLHQDYKVTQGFYSPARKSLAWEIPLSPSLSLKIYFCLRRDFSAVFEVTVESPHSSQALTQATLMRCSANSGTSYTNRGVPSVQWRWESWQRSGNAVQDRTVLQPS